MFVQWFIAAYIYIGRSPCGQALRAGASFVFSGRKLDAFLYFCFFFLTWNTRMPETTDSLTGSLFLIKLCVWHCGSDTGICSEKERAHHLSWGCERLLWWPLRIWTSFTESLNPTKLLIKKFFKIIAQESWVPSGGGGRRIQSGVWRRRTFILWDFILWDLGSAMRWNSQSQSWTFFKQEIWEASLSDTRPKLQSYRQSLSPVQRNILLNYCLCPVPKNWFFKLSVYYF